jgi:dolichol-phosphate mannosyltransferase
MLISIVIPVLNEEQVLQSFNAQLMEMLLTIPHDFEVLYIAGGSTDSTSSLIRDFHRIDRRVKLIELSRNYGHQAAITAGLDYASGDVVISMDGDGQHPPSLVPKMIEAYTQGVDIVLTQRRSTEQINRSAHLLSYWFYKVINYLSSSEIIPDSADFRLLSREVVDELNKMHEQHRFLRGMISWMGYQQTILPFDAPPRLGGYTKFTLRKRVQLASDAIFSFSVQPINLAIISGLFVLMLAVVQVVYVGIILLIGQREYLPPGWVSLMMAILGIGGVQLITIGIIGRYVGATFQESKRRPIYFVNKRLSTLDTSKTEPLDRKAVQEVNSCDAP